MKLLNICHQTKEISITTTITKSTYIATQNYQVQHQPLVQIKYLSYLVAYNVAFNVANV